MFQSSRHRNHHHVSTMNADITVTSLDRNIIYTCFKCQRAAVEEVELNKDNGDVGCCFFQMF